MAKLIFLVDSESVACESARHCLEEAGYAVRLFTRLVEVEEAQVLRPTLVLIAATLPDGSGFELCRRIRRQSPPASTALILLTASTNEDEICAALEAGADYCLTKPFTSRELLVRVQAALRHVTRPFPVNQPDIVIDHGAMKLCVRGSEVVTTALEFRLVDFLARHRGQVFTRDVLLDAVWGDMQFVIPRSVDTCIRRIREKIELDIKNPTFLKTVRGVGYRFDAFAVWPVSLDSCNCLACAQASGRAAQTRSLKLLTRQAAS